MPKDYQEERFREKLTTICFAYEEKTGISVVEEMMQALTTYGNTRELEGVEKERWRCAGIVKNYNLYKENEEMLLDIIDDIHDPEQYPIDDDGQFIKAPEPKVKTELKGDTLNPYDVQVTPVGKNELK